MDGNNGLNDIISKLTQNPEMMKNLMNVAGNIMNENEHQHHSKDDIRYEKNEYEPKREEDCHIHHKKRGDDAGNLICLLLALKPYVSDERCKKIDSIIKILKLVQLSEKTGVLKSLL